MSASRAPRFLAFLLSLALVSALAPASAGATTALPPPDSMAAVGDSITQAASSGGSLGADYPENSWSTGSSSTVVSHYLRLAALNPDVSRANHSKSGAKVADLAGQMSTLDAVDPDYLTVLIGGNDLCTDTIEEMTPVEEFRTQFRDAMVVLLGSGEQVGVSPNTKVYVVSIPDVHQLWELFKNNFFARAVWSAGNICQSLLANPTSNQQADQDRRAAFRQRNIDYNTQLAQVCEEFGASCHFDGHVVFGSTIERGDVSGDYFHPSVQGQAKLASVSWDVGYTWTTGSEPAPENASPTAKFTFSCTDLACGFTDTSTDSDGSVVAWSWNFGDGVTSTAQHPSHTYAAGGTYTVSLTVTDDGGATASTSQSVSVSAATTTITLTVKAYKDKGLQKADLSWSGATATNVDVYRDGAVIATTANDGAYTDSIGARGGGSYTYWVCEAGTNTCSNEATASY